MQVHSAEQVASIDWYAEAERIGAKSSSIDDARQKKLVGHYLVCPEGRGSGLRFIAGTNVVPHDPEGFEYEVRRVHSLMDDDLDVTPSFVDSSRPAQMKPRSIGGKAKLLILGVAQVRQILVEKFDEAAKEPAPVEEAPAIEGMEQGVLLRLALTEIKALRGQVDQLTTLIAKLINCDSKGQRLLPGT